jgi:DNA recombination protein RmuC
MYSLVYLITGTILGGVATWLVFRQKIKGASDLTAANAAKDLAVAQEKLSSREQELVSAQRQLNEACENLGNQKKAVEELNIQNATSEERMVRIPILEKELAESKQSLSKESELKATISNQLAEVSTQADERGKRLEELKIELGVAKKANQELEQQIATKNIALADMAARVTEERRQMDEKLALLNEAKEQMKTDFQNLANQILEEKSKTFTEQNKEKLDGILLPLREQLGDFKKKVEDVYDKESQGRATLLNEIGNLQKLNLKISEDAINLTNALKGDNKAQGNWGQLALERVLEMSGLEKGREYEIQVHAHDEEGNRFLPDVVIRLPQEKDVVVDAKVSLNAYEQYCSVSNPEERIAALNNHLLSMRNHIRDLSLKKYDSLKEIRSLDYVLMFIPIEAAFLTAIKEDKSLFSEAFTKNIILVCPSTLLVTLRTIANIWRYEYQNQNAQEIARKAADLYDKIVSFIETLQEVGDHLKKSTDKYEAAMKSLSSGKGNVIRRIEEFKQLGVKGKKTVPQELLGQIEDVEESLATVEVEKIDNQQ